MEHIGTISYNFNTYSHKQDNKSILRYTSEESNKVPIKGFYSTIFQFAESSKNKIVALETESTFCGITEAIDKLVSCLVEPTVLDILNYLK